jgi:hypothetical protein
MMRVPVNFRDRINKEADEQKLPATTYLENKRVVEVKEC